MVEYSFFFIKFASQICFVENETIKDYQKYYQS